MRARRAAVALFVFSSLAGAMPRPVAAQAPAESGSRARSLDAPPVTPRRAFLYSLAIPGLGQAALDRRYAGAAFFFIEAFSLAVVRRSADDLRVAKAFVGDSVPLRYDIDAQTGLARRDAKGDPIVAAWQVSPYPAELIRSRNLQLEDWIAVVIFNHLIAGADAFVAANLWDLPQHVSLRAFPVARGAGLAVSVPFR